MWPGCSSAKALGCCGTSLYRIFCLSFLTVLGLPPTCSIVGVSYVSLAISTARRECRGEVGGYEVMKGKGTDVESDKDQFSVSR